MRSDDLATRRLTMLFCTLELRSFFITKVLEMRLLLLFVISVLLLTQCKQKEAGAQTESVTPYAHVNAQQAAEMIANDASVIVLDVRTPEEYNASHIEGAVNIDYRADGFENEIAKLDKSKKYLVHCRSGGRSTKSAKIMQRLGFKDIVHMDGGYNDYQDLQK